MMTFEEPQTSRFDTFAGGVASVGSLMQAAYDATLYADNTNSRYFAVDSAYEQRIETARRETGRVVDNPLRAADAAWRRQETERPQSPLATMRTHQRKSYAEIAAEETARFEATMQELARQHPDKAARLLPGRSIEDDAKEIARNANAELDRLASSRAGFGKWLGILAGGAGASLRDPLQIAMLAAGGGPGAGRTIAARVLNVAMKEALVNGLAEAALQPAVQAWRREAGLPNGWDEATRNVIFAAGLGGAFGGVLGGAGEIAQRVLRGAEIDAAAARAAAEPGLRDSARAALAGDAQAARAELPAIRAALPPSARGALDHGEALDLIDAQRPKTVPPEIHDRAVAAATQQAETGRAAAPVLDTAQAERIALTLEPEIKVKAVRGPKAATLTDFLIAKGGLVDQNGEVLAVTGGQVAKRGKGSLIRDDGLNLDSARELAAQNGYLDRLYGNPDEATARSTIADFLNLLDEDMRIGGVRPGFATQADNVAAGLALSRGRIADDVLALQKAIGPGVDDATIIRAINIARDEGIDPLDAFERAAMEAPEPEARPQRSGEALPGWSDEELLAASESRPADLLPDGVDDPADLPDWYDAEVETLGDDLDALQAGELVEYDNELLTAAQLRDRLAADADEIALVKACRT